MTIKLSRALCASTALVTGLLVGTSAFAQSTTGSSTVEELVVTGNTGPKSLDGVIVQTAPKTRTTIDQEFIARQLPGQSIAASLNMVPGYNFTNNDAYGNSGGNIRVRSFDCPRISFQWDGMQLNDSGNYACFTNQVGDSEIVATADVAQGTTDVDAPSASSTGGSINYTTKVPTKEFSVVGSGQLGTDNFRRGYAEVDSGEIGPWGTRFLVAGSYTKYDKFKGPGTLEKDQFNARIYQPLNDGRDFASLAFHYNRNRNNFYNNPSLAQYRQFGYAFDNDQVCNRLAPVAGTAQNENNNNIIDFLGRSLTGSCTNYYNLRINPSNTANIRGQFKYHFTDNLILTVDPNFQYVLANGGGFTAVPETDGRLRGKNIVTNAANANVGGAGKDLNGDGDTLDTVTLYTPNNTNTRRYGLNASLIYKFNENNTFRLAYAYDDAHHRQTAENGFVDPQGNPLSVFGGKDSHGDKVTTADGLSFLRGRDRKSIARLNMVAAEYDGRFLDDALEVRLGVRAPFFKRELNQFCYSADGTSNVLCTTQPTLTTVGTTTLTNGNVFIAGQGTTQYIAPYKATKKYDKVLPNIGVDYKFLENHSVYASFAQGLSAPKTDNLYTVKRVGTEITNPVAKPETTDTFDVGYRYTLPNMQATLAAYKTNFKNRIVSSFDPDLGIFIDRNLGSVHISGIDAGLAFQPAEYLTYTANVSYNRSIVQRDTPGNNGLLIPTKGKRLVETPKWTWFQRVQWDITENVSFGAQAKYVGERYSTDVNDEKSKEYATVDLDVRWNLPFMEDHKIYVQGNITNVFDDKYLGSISSVSNATAILSPTGAVISSAGTARYALGAPRTYQITLHAEF